MSASRSALTGTKPQYIYKLIPSTAPVPDSIPDRLPTSELDQRSGFIHLSTALQVPNTLKHFFKDEPLVYVLRIEYDRVEKDLRWESPDAKVCGPRTGEGMFPVCISYLSLLSFPSSFLIERATSPMILENIHAHQHASIDFCEILLI
jgi:uncharacterized protein (DUF952 family)